MIQLEHLSKSYNGVLAVDDLNLTIPDGEIFGLLGPNGAGKSTTILMMIGLIQPTAGRCLINNLDVARDPIAVKQKIGYIPEDVGFYGNLTAEENLTYFARLYRMDPDRRRIRIPKLLDMVGLQGVTKHVGGYSKGMRQRLGLAKALLNEPSLVLLDEPTANLDPQGVADYRRIIQETAANGATVIVSSHILEEVSKVCSSVGILSRGKLVASGAWKDLAAGLESGSEGHVTIQVEARDPIPEIQHPDLTSMTMSDDRLTATIIARSDIRESICDQLAARGVRLLGITRKGLSLEEMFMTYYRQAG